MNSALLSQVCRRWLLPVIAALGFGAQAKVLDNFDAATRSGWEDSDPGGFGLPGGQQGGGRFTFDLPALGQPFFVNSRKTSETFELKEGRTIEYRVDLVSGRGPDSFAVLAFIPQATGPNTLAGYGISKSETDILISKGINKYFFNENPTPAIKNQNVTLVLNLKVKGGNVLITGQVLDKDDGNKVIFEKTFTDTPAADVLSDGKDEPPGPFINQVGNFVLYLYADGGTDPAGYEVVFDNAETFVTDETVLDDFNAATRSGWEDSDPGGFGLPGGQQGGGHFTFNLPALGQPFFVNSKKTTTTFELAEGTRHEFSVDLVSGQGPDSFVVLGFIPQATGPNTLAGYGIAKSETDMLVTKGINKYFFNENLTPALKNSNVRLTLTLTVQNGNVTIRSRVFDKDAGDAVIFDKTFVDTPAAEVLSDGKDEPPAPFINLVGNVVLYLYADGGTDPNGYQVVLDNLIASAPPAAANQPPIITEVTPIEGANFLPATTQVTFKLTDDANVPDAGVKVTLNGTTYTTANGLTLSAAGMSRTASLGGFAANQTYLGQISVTDAGNVERTATVAFDTFTGDDRVVEIEDYNFESGGYFNSPVRTAEGAGSAGNSYTDRVGTPGVDYSDTRTAPNGADTLYRTGDFIRMAHSLDRRRAQFNNDSSVYDYDVGDLAAGEWMNYTREFATGTYEVYLREAVVNLPHGDSVLEQVTGDATQPDQTVKTIGSFLATTSGYTSRNVPLTDGAGLNRLKLRLSGKTTLRLRTVTPDDDTGNRLLNYLIFVPVADAGVQRATIASLSPANGTTTTTTEPKIGVALQNRDTSVNPATVKLSVNGSPVTAQVTATADGATVAYTFPTLPPKDVAQSARIIFADNEGVAQTNDWSFTITYSQLDPSTRLAGPGPVRGIKIRVVQGQDAGQNSLDYAESQLSTGSTIAKFYDLTVTNDVINFSQNAINEGGTDGYFDGDLPIPGQTLENGDDNFALEAMAFLDLPAGVIRFGVRSDDGYKVASALNPNASTTPLAFHNGGPADETFDVVVPQAGVYAFRFVWYERSGAAHVEWFTVNRTTGDRTLVNAAGGIASYTSAATGPALLGSASLTGQFQPLAGAQVDPARKTITVPIDGAAAAFFFRVQADTAVGITQVKRVGDTIVITYQ